MRVVDAYVFYESARAALFSDAIVRFLRIVFDDAPMLFQSLTFEKGRSRRCTRTPSSSSPPSPLEFAASWTALEDIRLGRAS